MASEQFVLRALDSDTVSDFFFIHSKTHDTDWCFCSAWWVRTWEGWGQRSAEQNLDVRNSILQRGEYDGFILYKDSKPVAWAQVCQRDKLEKLVDQFSLEPDESVWSITCMLVVPNERRAGVARVLLERILEHVKATGVTTVQVFPKRVSDPDELDLWNGPEQLYRDFNFTLIKEDGSRPVYEFVF